jgi:hypothetical protein
MTDCGKNWKIFILAHQKIYDEMYENDKHFNNKNYQVINVNTKRNVEL